VRRRLQATARLFECRAWRGNRIALLNHTQSASVGEGNDTVKKRKPAKKPLAKEPPLNLSGIKFEEGLRIMLNTPPLPKPKK
jgi:hypothetical protein